MVENLTRHRESEVKGKAQRPAAAGRENKKVFEQVKEAVCSPLFPSYLTNEASR